MYFDRIYLEDNFVPDVVFDQFRRKKIGVSICIKEGESMDNAIAAAETFIKEFIQKNTVYPDHQHIEVRNVDVPLPIIQYETPTAVPQYNGLTLEQQIFSCDDIKVLESYYFIAKKDEQLQRAYNTRLSELKPKTKTLNT